MLICELHTAPNNIQNNHNTKQRNRSRRVYLKELLEADGFNMEQLRKATGYTPREFTNHWNLWQWTFRDIATITILLSLEAYKVRQLFSGSVKPAQLDYIVRAVRSYEVYF